MSRTDSTYHAFVQTIYGELKRQMASGFIVTNHQVLCPGTSVICTGHEGFTYQSSQLSWHTCDLFSNLSKHTYEINLSLATRSL